MYPLPLDFQVPLDSLHIAASGLKRPECVLATSNGELHSADWRGGVAVTRAQDKVSKLIIAKNHGAQPGASALLPPSAPPLEAMQPLHSLSPARPMRPNGIALTRSGTYLFADLGETEGGIFSLSANGELTPLITKIDGRAMPPSNFVIEDQDERIWFTVSTRLIPRNLAWRAEVSDGFIAVRDAQGSRIVADGLGYTNEIAFSPDGRWLYVNETYARRVSRFALLPGATLGPKETVAQLGPGNFPDGLVFDAYGGLWLTCIVGNRVLVIRPEGAAQAGQVQTILDGGDAAYIAQFEAKYLAGQLTPADTATCGHSSLGNISSLAFGGSDLRTAYLGCLLDDKIRSFPVPIPGATPLHWHFGQPVKGIGEGNRLMAQGKV
jgi:sugar lactone lactonase YvrE